eukprot:Seg388.8 transcript_id=Seg388.8/GoldUCD/mRNA.D3Y31 product="hypothetical protein" protein_id=Seg388.8/GoldUCD/D3Y31
MADKSREESCPSPSTIRREIRSEGYLPHLEGSQHQSVNIHRNAMRTRSYSQNDSETLRERLDEQDGRRRYSLTEMLLGRRSLYSTSQSVVSQTVDEVSESTENLEMNESNDTVLSMSVDNRDAIFDAENSNENLTAEGDQPAARKTTQTDHLNKRLLDVFLERISSFAGPTNPGTVHKGDNEGKIHDDTPEDVNRVYSDDFLMDRIVRKLNTKKGK